MLILFYLVEYDEEIISIANNIKNINLDDIYFGYFEKNCHSKLCFFMILEKFKPNLGKSKRRAKTKRCLYFSMYYSSSKN